MDDQNSESRFAVAARTGDLEGLAELVDSDFSEHSDGLAYKWFAVASDFGHDEADEMIDALLTGPLHADDDDYVTGHAHLELAVSYLTGGEGLPVDYDRARKHVEEMVSRRYPYTVQDGEGLLAEAREGMSPAARAVFDAALARPVDRAH